MNFEFSEHPWHDAELVNICIDRRRPGDNDCVIIEIIWPNGLKNNLVFNDCYGLKAVMNFGVIAPESILEASIIDDSTELTEIREKWSLIGADLKNLKCFEIKTNSTASTLHIYALGFSFVN